MPCSIICPFCQTTLTKAETADHCCLGMLQTLAIARASQRVGRRIVEMSADVRARAREIVAYADAHPYRPMLDGSDGNDAAPGSNPNHVMHVPVGIRAVYSRTIDRNAGDLAYRHLSISLMDAPERVAAPEVSIAIAKELFGFVGSPVHWLKGFSDESVIPRIVTLAQPYAATVHA